MRAPNHHFAHSTPAQWQVTRIPFAKPGPVVVDAWGLILNSSTSHYPAYTYVDAIGGSGTLSLF
jgi:hypothetical protein